MSLTITHRDGSREPFDADRINRAIEQACYGLTNPTAKITQIASETQLTLYDGITTTELDQAVINTTVQNIQEDIEFDRVAVRLRLKTVYKKFLAIMKPQTRLETFIVKDLYIILQLVLNLGY